MKFQGAINVLACVNLEGTLRFYQDLLHFIVLKKTVKDDKLVWAHIRSDQVELMLEYKPSTDNEGHSSRFYLFSDDIHATHHFIRARGCDIPPLALTEFGMLEFTLSDPEGHQITIGQKIR